MRPGHLVSRMPRTRQRESLRGGKETSRFHVLAISAVHYILCGPRSPANRQKETFRAGGRGLPPLPLERKDDICFVRRVAGGTCEAVRRSVSAVFCRPSEFVDRAGLKIRYTLTWQLRETG